MIFPVFNWLFTYKTKQKNINADTIFTDVGLFGPWMSKIQSARVPEVYIFVPNLEHLILRVIIWNKKYIVANKIFL